MKGIALFRNLTYLDLSDNQIEIAFQDEGLNMLENLEYLNLSSNQLGAHRLT